jgi:hypothetical protein
MRNKIILHFHEFLLNHCVRNGYAVHRPIAFCNSCKLYKILSVAKTKNYIKIENNILVLSCSRSSNYFPLDYVSTVS